MKFIKREFPVTEVQPIITYRGDEVSKDIVEYPSNSTFLLSALADIEKQGKHSGKLFQCICPGCLQKDGFHPGYKIYHTGSGYAERHLNSQSRKCEETCVLFQEKYFSGKMAWGKNMETKKHKKPWACPELKTYKQVTKEAAEGGANVTANKNRQRSGVNPQEVTANPDNVSLVWFL